MRQGGGSFVLTKGIKTRRVVPLFFGSLLYTPKKSPTFVGDFLGVCFVAER